MSADRGQRRHKDRVDGTSFGADGQSESPLVEIDGQQFYVVRDVDRIPPFLMSIVSDGDRWMFISSSGGVTAGRRDVTRALFPYETDDRLHNLGGLNGSVTTIHVVGSIETWHPMTGEIGPGRHRNLYKAVSGNSVIFEEHDEATDLTFRYRWASSERFGFVRTATLINGGERPCAVDLKDGLRNILPYGLEPSLYLSKGNLTNAYKRSELIDPDLRMAVYSLESLVNDLPEPAEALRATVVWSTGLDNPTVSLHPDAPRAAQYGLDRRERLVTGSPGAYFLGDTVKLNPGDHRTWAIVADVSLDQAAVVALEHELRSVPDRAAEIAASTRRASQSLVEIMARADALQSSGDDIANAHHFSNVTYNVMRGGLPLDAYSVEVGDFEEYLGGRNRDVAELHHTLLSNLGTRVDRSDLIDRIDATGDVDLQRLGREYLPLSFSRRHGDPSRPWNAFSIRTTDDDGNPVRHYEGNWRDIFQNWEAMCMSFPGYLPDIASLFVDASTADGFNPYRITSEGIDWEVPDPEDPWSNIGYWGDHQIVYLLRLLKAGRRYYPETVDDLLGGARFTYANVPYRIAPYDRLLVDPKDTIEYDREAEQRIAERVESVGTDGKLVWSDGGVYHVTLAEKLMVPALAKLSNFVPGGGIWMNTQRPEWNDANNALVGFGLSMVTLYQLRAYLDHLRDLVGGSTEEVAMSREVADWLGSVTRILSSAPLRSHADTADRDRKRLMDQLGSRFSDYRDHYYESGFSGTTTLSLSHVTALCDIGIAHLDSTISDARRDDGLFDSYNLIRFSDDGVSASVVSLGEMLEGQVAVLDSGVLGAAESADLVDALFSSALFRADQGSFLLYPVRVLPAFLDRNVVPSEAIANNPLLAELLVRGDGTVIGQDIAGHVRFNADLPTRQALEDRLECLADSEIYGHLVDKHRSVTVRTYERVFGHDSYTGRSGSMYAYEGIGSIFWHMVAKLTVALQEAAFRAAKSGAHPAAVGRIVDGYWRVRAGMGFNKTPAEHGAIPIDPHSHTPAHAGAQQPGMSGLVKEELLVRPAELGVIIDEGEIRFDSTFLRSTELLGGPTTWRTLDEALEWRTVDLPARSCGLTMCQVPIIVMPTDGEPRIEVDLLDGTVLDIPGISLGRELSAEIFGRTGQITCVRAHISAGLEAGSSSNGLPGT